MNWCFINLCTLEFSRKSFAMPVLRMQVLRLAAFIKWGAFMSHGCPLEEIGKRQRNTSRSASWRRAGLNNLGLQSSGPCGNGQWGNCCAAEHDNLGQCRQQVNTFENKAHPNLHLAHSTAKSYDSGKLPKTFSACERRLKLRPGSFQAVSSDHGGFAEYPFPRTAG